MTGNGSAHLTQINDAIRQIQIYLDGVQRERFLSDPLLQDAVAMRFILIGEAAARLLQLDPQLPAGAPAIPWAQMRGLRNRLVHAYGAIDHEAVWDTARLFLPELQAALDGLKD